mmetsp:Transcript_23548/g.53729  ORF Transcript_23548/g.53729 Transcript_23548/m.53729 type:complete len:147 (-) Transcript_23548:474-914(-)|eukprot:CAMPEP_0113306410 /NCGR_PEP_ID=MMETSP0010_2-20120614/5672_1 /TAXON_ID=216773 ORGANISM="Corethron hystrix, Strain 308" /NCGR_SAMPLE_ID=MMETSP0010_2 /ASSEMBLY_ACC=CAM_ASM_000155 /LENGTH=146 /DNA_ID=CAMNT_0000161071 /DNA_START=79 /DNA_END=519 /DNA_ORIENTATION=+ /assembly_acc=CAM_ASM_000155
MTETTTAATENAAATIIDDVAEKKETLLDRSLNDTVDTVTDDASSADDGDSQQQQQDEDDGDGDGEEEYDEEEERPSAKEAAIDILDQLVELFVEKNGREPNQEEVMQWIDVFKNLEISDGETAEEEDKPSDDAARPAPAPASSSE